MVVRRRRFLFLAASLLAAASAFAAETSGGPVNTILTLAGEPMTVSVTWLQSGGVVILKIVSSSPIGEELRTAKMQAADKLLKGRPGYRASYNGNGQLVLTFRITGWNKPFTEQDMGIGAKP